MSCPIDLTGISDSIILAALIYLFALLIRRDVALRLLGVMGILVAFSLLARLSRFAPLIRVIDVIVLSMPVVLAIIFQNDLRRALLMLGKRQQQINDQPTDNGAVDEVMQALSDLASRQMQAVHARCCRWPVGL